MTSAWPPPQPTAEPSSLQCYRHSKANAPVSCTRCDRPICSDCMISAPVGWQCPECVKGGPAVRRMRDVGPGGSLVGARPMATYILMGLSLLGFVAQMGDPTIASRFGISGFGVADGRIEQIVTSGFLHVDLIHLGFNMAVLFQIGTALEARLGWARYVSLYAASLLGGSMGVLLLSTPQTVARGASGAVFGLMAATFVLPRRSRYGIEASVGGLLAINLVITFALPGISIGGHLGGLVAGGLVGLAYRLIGESAENAKVVASAAFAVVVTLCLAVAAMPVADWVVTTRL